jgi:hypothetical protein
MWRVETEDILKAVGLLIIAVTLVVWLMRGGR